MNKYTLLEMAWLLYWWNHKSSVYKHKIGLLNIQEVQHYLRSYILLVIAWGGGVIFFSGVILVSSCLYSGNFLARSTLLEETLLKGSGAQQKIEI